MEKQLDFRRRCTSWYRRLPAMMLLIGGLAGCMPAGGGHSPTASETTILRVSVTPAPLQTGRDVPGATTRMWLSDFRDAVEGMEGEWRVRVPRNSTCRLIFEEPNLLSRRGNVQLRGGCFDDLFFTRFWTMTGARELVLLDMTGHVQGVYSGMTPILFRSDSVTLERAPFVD